MSFKDKIRNIVFGPDEYEGEEELEYQMPADIRQEKKEPSKVVSLHTSMQMEVVINIPESFGDSKDICDNLRENKPVIVNLEKLELETAQRVMDFISGGCYCLGGSIQRVASNIFIIAPTNVDLSGDLKEELKQKGIILPWGKQTE